MTTARTSTKISSVHSGLLANLVFSSEKAPSKADVSQRSPRKVMLDAIAEQIKIVEAELRRETYTVTRIKVSKSENGSRVKNEVRVMPRRMFWEQDGKWFVSLRYGGRIPLELSPGKPSIVAGGSLKEVLGVLEIVRNAVNAGEMDEAIEQAALKAKRKGNKMETSKNPLGKSGFD